MSFFHTGDYEPFFPYLRLTDHNQDLSPLEEMKLQRTYIKDEWVEAPKRRGFSPIILTGALGAAYAIQSRRGVDKDFRPVIKVSLLQRLLAKFTTSRPVHVL
jgi:hypothetical protein